MPDLHGWIDQQIARIEAVAGAATPGQWETRDHDDQPGMLEVRAADEPDFILGYIADVATDDGHHIALHSPENILRRCAADRKILKVHAPQGGGWEPYACLGCGTDSEFGVLVDHTNDCETLRALAEGYGLTEEQRVQLDRPEPEPRQRRMGGLFGAGIAEAMYGDLMATFINARPVKPRPEVKAMEILAPELKKIPGYVSAAEEASDA